MRRANGQRGMALVLALVLVAVVVVMATALSSDFLLMFRRVENQLYSEQAYAYLVGAEGLARAALLQDVQRDNQLQKKFDYLKEDWAKEQQFPTDYGAISGVIEDMQGRFNLNSLAAAPSGQNPAPTGTQLQFTRLLLTLQLEQPLALDQAQALTEAIGDWVDIDDDVRGLGGAENQYYADAKPMGRAANRTMASPSELMWVKGMTPEIYRALAPLVTVWPNRAGTSTKINVNTAPPQILATLGDDKDPQPLSETEVNQLVQDRAQHNYFESIEALRAESVLKGKTIFVEDLDLRSDFFMLNVQTDFQGHRYSMHSLLQRDSNKRTVHVVQRTFGDL